MDEFEVFEQEKSFWNPLNSVIYILETYGWYLLIACIALIVIYQKTLKSYIQKFREYKFERDYAAKYHKNPDVFAAHVNAQQQWAQKLQEKYNKESEEYQRKMKEKEEKKREELQRKYEPSGGHVLGRKDDTSNLRPGYNPLMGAGSSSNYRPPRKSPCGGGGCGR
ncbi:selenoprotein S-like [Tribolium madens]|uniref:selenoprotein S-like n=1 Tax=Tribolium madens TaxID=41895 RepID=UPI001CF71F2B|nr:selenoprotein S-like [Tribolium madens]